MDFLTRPSTKLLKVFSLSDAKLKKHHDGIMAGWWTFNGEADFFANWEFQEPFCGS
jgi:hypothetical protein